MHISRNIFNKYCNLCSFFNDCDTNTFYWITINHINNNKYIAIQYSCPINDFSSIKEEKHSKCFSFQKLITKLGYDFRKTRKLINRGIIENYNK